MSSSAMAAPSSSDIPEKGTAAHKIYYYAKIEQSAYRSIARAIEQFPTLSVCTTWLSLGDADRKVVMSKVKNLLQYEEVNMDVEDQELLDDFTHVALQMATSSEQMQKRATGRRKSRGNTLLKSAIRHSNLAKQATEKSNSQLLPLSSV